MNTKENKKDIKMTKTAIIIPARYGSSRLEGKPLLKVNDKPIIQWVYEKAKTVKSADVVIVATDDERILPGENKVKTLKCGDEITLESYSAAYWYIDGVMVTRSVTYTLVVPAHDCTIETRNS